MAEKTLMMSLFWAPPPAERWMKKCLELKAQHHEDQYEGLKTGEGGG
jgi:hypothetical protein